MNGRVGKVAQIRTSGSEHRFESTDEGSVVGHLRAGYSACAVASAFGMSTRKVRRIARRHGLVVE